MHRRQGGGLQGGTTRQLQGREREVGVHAGGWAEGWGGCGRKGIRVWAYGWRATDACRGQRRGEQSGQLAPAGRPGRGARGLQLGMQHNRAGMGQKGTGGCREGPRSGQVQVTVQRGTRGPGSMQGGRIHRAAMRWGLGF